MSAIWNLIEENLGNDFAENKLLQRQIQRLSTAFTEGRGQLDPDYLAHPQYQSAYLAYFLPLNFRKVEMLLQAHQDVWPEPLPALMRWVDFGCGPGTASLAALSALRTHHKKSKKLPEVHIDLVDSQPEALELAKALIHRFAEKIQLRVTLATHENLDAVLSKEPRCDLALAANVLNELPAESGTEGRELLLKLWDMTSGIMMVLEPGHRVSSQRLIRFRERLLKEGRETVSFLGPCPHHEKCPLHRTQHWCHFSEPGTDGRLIDLNLRVFKNPRNWLKFSYLLFKREKAPEYDPEVFRAIGDLHLSRGHMAIDLCQPNSKWLFKLPRNIPPHLRDNLVRGALVRIDEDRQVQAKTLTQRMKLVRR